MVFKGKVSNIHSNRVIGPIIITLINNVSILGINKNIFKEEISKFMEKMINYKFIKKVKLFKEIIKEFNSFGSKNKFCNFFKLVGLHKFFNDFLSLDLLRYKLLVK